MPKCMIENYVELIEAENYSGHAAIPNKPVVLPV